MRLAKTARSFLLLAGLASGSAAWSNAARADVLEIAPDGSLTTYAGPAVYSPQGAIPIVQPLPVLQPVAISDVSGAISAAADRYALSPALIEAVAWQETRLRHASISPKGAVGLMQLMPATARGLGVDPYDLAQNAFGGAAYLSQLLQHYDGDLTLALAAYNAGPAAVDRYRGVPPYAETRAYVAAVLDHLSKMTQSPRATVAMGGP